MWLFINRITYRKVKKYNIYDLTGEYGIGYTSNANEEFYFDLEDYDKISGCCWSSGSIGYIHTVLLDKIVRMHRFLLNPNEYEVIDHINHNTYDNRKMNLRKTTTSENQTNKKIQTNNTSGVTGVRWVKNRNKWVACININKKSIQLGSFLKFEDAVTARKEAEDKYYGEYKYIKENDERLINNV